MSRWFDLIWHGYVTIRFTYGLLVTRYKGRVCILQSILLKNRDLNNFSVLPFVGNLVILSSLFLSFCLCLMACGIEDLISLFVYLTIGASSLTTLTSWFSCGFGAWWSSNPYSLDRPLIWTEQRFWMYKMNLFYAKFCIKSLKDICHNLFRRMKESQKNFNLRKRLLCTFKGWPVFYW